MLNPVPNSRSAVEILQPHGRQLMRGCTLWLEGPHTEHLMVSAAMPPRCDHLTNRLQS